MPSDFGVAAMVSTLAANDLRFELMISALIETIKDIKNPDGTPMVTEAMLEAKVEMVKKKMQEEMTKSNIILPGSPAVH